MALVSLAVQIHSTIGKRAGKVLKLLALLNYAAKASGCGSWENKQNQFQEKPALSFAICGTGFVFHGLKSVNKTQPQVKSLTGDQTVCRGLDFIHL